MSLGPKLKDYILKREGALTEGYFDNYIEENWLLENMPIKELRNTPNDLFEHLVLRLIKVSMPYWLRVEDGISMMNSLETRVPFLDGELIDYALSIPNKDHYNKGKNKSMLRDSFKDLPLHILKQKTKAQRPGSTKRLIFQVFQEEAKDVFNYSNQLFSKSLTDKYVNDLKL